MLKAALQPIKNQIVQTRHQQIWIYMLTKPNYNQIDTNRHQIVYGFVYLQKMMYTYTLDKNALPPSFHRKV